MRNIYSVFFLAQDFKRQRRFQRILFILAKYGYSDLSRRLGLRGVWFRLKHIFGSRTPDLTQGQRLRMVFEELGPTYIKLAQVLAGRPDLLPRKICDELALLQDSVPPAPFDRVRERLECSFGKKLDEVFAEFDELPIAAASIAQVHRARLKDGAEVAVKVRRPGIRRQIKEDLAVMRDVAAKLSEAYPDLLPAFLPAFVDEFGRNLALEVDFVNERRNQERFARNFEDEPRLLIPGVHAGLSDRDVLVMDFVRGLKLAEHETWQESGIDRKAIASAGMEMMLRSIFEHRFFHADPHPGNFFALEGNRLCLLDFGMMGTFDAKRADEIVSFLSAMLTRDAASMVRVLVDAEVVPELADRRAFQRDLEQLLGRIGGLSLDQLDIGSLMMQVVDTAKRHKVTFPPDLMLIGRAMSSMESAAAALTPGMKPLAEIAPYVASAMLKRAADPEAIAERIVDKAEQLVDLIDVLPAEVQGILRRLRRGELQLVVKDPQAKEKQEAADRRLNRVLVGGFSATAFATWVLMLQHTSVIPAPIIWADFGIAVLTLIWALYGIWRSGGV